MRVSGEGKGLLHLWVVPGVALDSARSPWTQSGLAPPGRSCRGSLPSARLGQHPHPPQAGQGSQAGLRWVVGPGWASVSPAPRSWLGSSELPTACLRHCPRQSCRPPSRAEGPAASDSGQGGGWAGAEAAGTKRGLSGLGPGRRLRPCSAASEGPVFRSQAAGSPAQAQETSSSCGFSSHPSGPREAAAPQFLPCALGWVGVPRSVRVQHQRGVLGHPWLGCWPAWSPGAGQSLSTQGHGPAPDRTLRTGHSGLCCPQGSARPGAGPPHPGAELGGPPDLHDMAGTEDTSGCGRFLGAAGGCSPRNVASLGAGLATVPLGDARAAGSRRLSGGAGRWRPRRRSLLGGGGVATGNQWGPPDGPS